MHAFSPCIYITPLASQLCAKSQKYVSSTTLFQKQSLRLYNQCTSDAAGRHTKFLPHQHRLRLKLTTPLDALPVNHTLPRWFLVEHSKRRSPAARPISGEVQDDTLGFREVVSFRWEQQTAAQTYSWRTYEGRRGWQYAVVPRCLVWLIQF